MMNEREFYERHGRLQRTITVERYKQLNKSVIKGQTVFSGSSLAEQFPINEMLQSRQKSYHIYNRGVSGDTIEGLKADLSTLVLDLEPSKLFINIGSNNIGGETYDEDALFNKYTKILAKIADKLPKCQLYVLSYYPVNSAKESFLDDMAKNFMFANRTNENINRMNQRLDKHCKDLGYTYIDVNSCLLDSEGKLDLSLTVEGIHLWPIAYEKVLDVLESYL